MEFQKQEYDNIHRKMNLKVAIAIFCILFGITLLMLGAEYLTESQMLIPIGAFAVLLVIAIGLIFKVGIESKNYRKKVSEIPECYTDEEKKAGKQKWKQVCIATLIVAVVGMLAIVAVYVVNVVENLSLLPVAIFFFCLTLLLPQMAYWKLELEKMDAGKYNKQGKEDRKKVICCSIGMGITIILTILVSVILQNWDISFLVFLFGSVISIAIATMEKKK